MPQTTTVSVRMYNMGFGDAFLVTVCRDHQVWRMLVDCGVHSQGQARPINEAVDAIIADLAAASVDGRPHLDVIIATHHHADHIVGFSLPAWEQVTVDEVWVPFVEDEADPDTTALRRAQTETANQLLRLIESRKQQMSSGGGCCVAGSRGRRDRHSRFVRSPG
jgi:glyoxylase-like metal-dependent hydrolase (beta-lactamase superfamily II)